MEAVKFACEVHQHALDSTPERDALRDIATDALSDCDDIYVTSRQVQSDTRQCSRLPTPRTLVQLQRLPPVHAEQHVQAVAGRSLLVPFNLSAVTHYLADMRGFQTSGRN